MCINLLVVFFSFTLIFVIALLLCCCCHLWVFCYRFTSTSWAILGFFSLTLTRNFVAWSWGILKILMTIFFFVLIFLKCVLFPKFGFTMHYAAMYYSGRTICLACCSSFYTYKLWLLIDELVRNFFVVLNCY